MAFNRSQFISVARRAGYSPDEINSELEYQGQKPLSTAEKVVASPAIPLAMGTAGAIAGSVTPFTPVLGGATGYGAGKAVQNMLLDLLGQQSKTPGEQVGQAVPEALGFGSLAGLLKTGLDLGKTGQKYYRAANKDKYIKKLTAKRETLLSQEEPMPLGAIEQDVGEIIPKMQQRGFSPKEINPVLENYMEGTKSLSTQVGRDPFMGELRQVPLNKLQQQINTIDATDYGGESLRKAIGSEYSNVLRNYYTKQIPGVADLNKQMEELYKAAPMTQELKRQAVQTSIRAPLYYLLYRILGPKVLGNQ